jgi:hypothetical protein
MAKMNLLKGSFTGRLGQMVGAKWKKFNTVRTLSQPSNPNTPAQQQVRGGFSHQTKFFTLFSAQLASLSALDTKAMSVRNALINLNKDYIKSPTLIPSTLKVSKGGLPAPTVSTAVYASATNTITITYSVPNSPVISQKAKVVFVAVSPSDDWAFVASQSAQDTEIIIEDVPELAGDISIYAYILDYRGSNRVGSNSIYALATAS